ncbi:MAG: hypothetical protein HKN78_05410 [Sphingomonadaceae bacterium]|nr:hypothetical protein [Sphingomonadaceae bacterium]
MITALLLMLAAPDAGASVQAQATATIVSAERIDFARLDAGQAETAAAQFSLIVEGPDPAIGGNGETRLVEFQ